MLRFLPAIRVVTRLLLAIIGCQYAAAQQKKLYYNNTAYNEKDGYVVFEKINKLTSDNQGLVWLGSDNGLYCFDGTYFTRYSKNTPLATGLPSNHIDFNFQDSKGNYVCYVYKHGLYQFMPASQTFKPLELKSTDSSFNPLKWEFTLPAEDKDGVVWLGIAGYGVGRLNLENKTITPFKICFPQSCGGYISSSCVTGIIPAAGNRLWLLTNYGMVLFNTKTLTSQLYIDESDKVQQQFANVYTSGYLKPGTDTIFLATWSAGVKIFNSRSGSFERYTWSNTQGDGTKNIAVSIAPKNDSTLWVASLDKGLMVFNLNTHRFTPVRNYKTPVDSIIAEAAMPDKRNNLWIANLTNFYRINISENKFIHYETPGKNPGCFLKSGSNIVFGCAYLNGVSVYNIQTGHLKTYQISAAGSRQAVINLKKDSKGRIWALTEAGVYWFNIATGKFTAPVTQRLAGILQQMGATDMVEATDGSFWIASYRGLLHWNENKGTVEHFGTANGLPSNFIEAVTEDSAGNVWFGMNSKTLGVYIGRTGKFRFYNDDVDTNLPSGNCTSVIATSKHILYTVRGSGLCILQHPLSTQEKVITLGTQNGMPSDRAYSLYKSKQNTIWIYTSNGLATLNEETLCVNTYNHQNGLAESNLLSNPYQDDEGSMYVGFLNGFQQFDPEALQVPPVVPASIFISDMKINGRQLIPQVNTLKQLELNHVENNISLRFSALNAGQPAALYYQWQLEGYDKTWNYAHKPEAVYINLPYGNYRLQIKAGYVNGPWSNIIFNLPVTISPPWWATWWFRLIILAAVAAIATTLFRYRIATIKKNQQLQLAFEKRVAAIEMKALRAQMNPHFIFNSLNSINRYIVKSDPVKASGYLNDFSKLIRLILENSSSEFITLDKDLEMLELYIKMEALRFESKFCCNLMVQPGLHTAAVLIPSMLVQPYVENAIWHGLLHKNEGDAILNISFVLKNSNLLEITIDDNGIGRLQSSALKSKHSLKQKSMGMDISRERLERINSQQGNIASVTVTDKPAGKAAGGTTVTLLISIKKV